MVDAGHVENAHHVDPTANSMDKVTAVRRQHRVTWHTKSLDSGKSTVGYYVCWTDTTKPFHVCQDVYDLNDFHFGEIKEILEITIKDQRVLFVHVNEFLTQYYEFGGYLDLQSGRIK